MRCETTKDVPTNALDVMEMLNDSLLNPELE